MGSLTDRVTVQRRTTVTEPEGGAAVAFVPVASVWARVRAVSYRQGRAADGRSVTVTHTAVMRFRSDLMPGDRLVYRSRPLEVVGAADLDGRRAWLSCACTETRKTG